VPRVAHLVGTAVFGVLHALVRTSLIMLLSLPFFDVQLAGASWPTAAVVVAVGSVPLIGLGILAGILPMLYPERGEQMSFMVQAFVLLVSGVYYSVDTLPGWLQAIGDVSPATYLLQGVRAAVIDGASVGDVGGDVLALVVFSVVLLPLSIVTFKAAERWAKRNGRLKRQG